MQPQPGTIQWVNQALDLAFIRPDGSGKMVFARLKALKHPVKAEHLRVGFKVFFRAKQEAEGLIASELSLA